MKKDARRELTARVVPHSSPSPYSVRSTRSSARFHSPAQHSHVNFIDAEEYPATVDLQNRSVAMIAKLFNAPVEPGSDATGVSTVGSSEAIILAVLAMKKKWKIARKAAGKSTENPNLVRRDFCFRSRSVGCILLRDSSSFPLCYRL